MVSHKCQKLSSCMWIHAYTYSRARWKCTFSYSIAWSSEVSYILEIALPMTSRRLSSNENYGKLTPSHQWSKSVYVAYLLNFPKNLNETSISPPQITIKYSTLLFYFWTKPNIKSKRRRRKKKKRKKKSQLTGCSLKNILGCTSVQ